MEVKNRKEDYWQRLESELAPQSDLEEKIDHLRRFSRTQIQILQEKDLAGELPLLTLFAKLTAVAEAVLRGGYQLSIQELLKKDSSSRGDFAVIAMGKFGGQELTYHSDLDIFYLFERPEDQEFYTRLGQRIISALTLLTREGSPYQIDTELRPSGNGGTLVSSLEAFREYHLQMGRTWERQALIKARPIIGNASFCKEIKKCAESISYQDYDRIQLAQDIHHLRTRMEKELANEKPGTYNLKMGRGGIVDIEFLVQYLQLLYGRSHPLLKTPPTVEALRRLGRESLLDPEITRRLEKAYLFYREIESRLRMTLDQPSDILQEDADWRVELERRFFRGESLLPRYLKTREEVRSLYEKVLQP